MFGALSGDSKSGYEFCRIVVSPGIDGGFDRCVKGEVVFGRSCGRSGASETERIMEFGSG